MTIFKENGVKEELMLRENEAYSSKCEEPLPSRIESAESHAGLSRRKFIQSAALVAGGGLTLKDTLLPQALDAVPLAAGAVICLTEDRIAATPTFSYRPYRSKAATAADTISWVQIDLTEPKFIEEVKLFPANQRTILGQDAYYAGERFSSTL